MIEMSQNIDVLNLDKIELNPYCNHGNQETPL